MGEVSVSYAIRVYADFNVRTTWPINPLEGYADLDTSHGAPARELDRARLIGAIYHLPLIAEDHGRRMSGESITTAIEFVRNLPTNCSLPRVAVDEDGDVVMAWDDGPGRCALTFEGSMLHMVVNPGAKSTHIKPEPYHGGHIQLDLLRHLPRRGP
jgi:hypothetical protein